MPFFFATTGSDDWRVRGRHILGVYELLGGLWGLTALARIAPVASKAATGGSDSAGVILWSAAAAPLLVLTIAGLLLMGNHRLGLRFSVLAQLLQLIWVSFSGWTFVFAGGLYLGAVAEGAATRLAYGWSVHVEVGTQSARNFIGINFAAAIALLVLACTQHRPEAGISSSDNRPGLS